MTDLTIPQQLQQLVAGQVIRPEGEQSYAFRHALLHEAVYGTLLRRERREVHGAVARALEALYAGTLDEHLADLAHHYFENEAWDKALSYARRAGELAQQRFAPHEAQAHYCQAIAAAERLGTMPPPELYRARGQVREMLGDFAGARADHETALAAARAVAQPPAEWQALLDLGYLWAGRDYAETGRYFQQALALARTLGDPATLGRSLNRVGNWHFNREEIPEALQAHAEALALFEAHPDPRGLAETLDLLGLTHGYFGDVYAGRRYYERAIALFRELDDRRGEASALAVMADLGPTFASDVVEPAISLREAHFLIDQALRLTCQIHWRAGEAYARLSLGSARLSAGDFAQAQREAQHGAAIAAEIDHRQWQTLGHLIRANIELELGQFAQARASAQTTIHGAQEINSPLWERYGRAVLASACLELGALDEAEAALADLSPTRRPNTAALRQMELALGRLALERGDPPAALAIVERLRASVPNPTPGAIIARLWKLHAEALAAQGRWAEAEALLLAALPPAREIRVMVWRLHASLAGVYAAQGRAADAAAQVAAARQVVSAVAGTIPDPAERATFTHTAEARLARPWPGGTVPA